MGRPRRLRSLRLPRRPGQAILLIALLAILAALRHWCPEVFQPAPTGPLEPGLYRVARVVDGDTFVLADVNEKIRLLGADTPETVHPRRPIEPWGPEATEFTEEFLAGGEVRLEFDVEPRDKHGRILAHVWVGDRMLSEELIRAGLARAMLRYPFSAAVKSRLRRAEAEAKNARRGIWSAGGGSAHGL